MTLGDVQAFLGVPYAAPPVGELRWKEPAPPKPWKEPLEAIRFGPACPQPRIEFFKSLIGKTDVMSEDCLYLNVWTPFRSPSDRLPVMVWIHGGGFYVDRASQPVYHGHSLAQKGVAVVSLNYRLGPFGFLAHPELTAESPHHSSGNYGLMDQIFALKWVQENIEGFGGDSGNVTIFGQSAGAVCVCALMVSPPAKGLFHRVIAQSGGLPGQIRFRGEAQGALQGMESLGRDLTARLNLAGEDDVLKAMRAKPWQEILEASQRPTGVVPGGGTLDHFSVDGYVLTEPPRPAFAQGRQANVPFITGIVSGEGLGFAGVIRPNLERLKGFVRARYGRLGDKILEFFSPKNDQEAYRIFLDVTGPGGFGLQARWHARKMSGIQPHTYLYHFARESEARKARGAGCFHGSEIPYIFRVAPEWDPFDEEDWRLSEEMSGYWVRFAKTGDPNGPGHVAWPAYDPETDGYLDFDVPIRADHHLYKEIMDFMEGLSRA
jgi:para-nitrobenzyl esterase